MSQYPEHDKLQTVKEDSSTIGEFLDWACDVKGVRLSTLAQGALNIEKLLAEYFEIDLDRIDAEKEQMFQDLRTANEQARAGVVESRGRTADTP